MDRRDILRRCGALGVAGGLGFLAGCSGGGENPNSGESEGSASLKVTDFNYEEGDSDNLVVTVTIENSGESEGSGHLYVTVITAEATSETEDGNETGDSDDTDDSNDAGGNDGTDDTGENDDTDNNNTVASRESQEVTVSGGETKTFEVPFEFTVEQFERRGSLDIDLRT